MTSSRAHLEHCIERWDANNTAAEQVARVGDFCIRLRAGAGQTPVLPYGGEAAFLRIAGRRPSPISEPHRNTGSGTAERITAQTLAKCFAA